jgi:hypothetical protein
MGSMGRGFLIASIPEKRENERERERKRERVRVKSLP